MKKPGFIITEKQSKESALIIDKKGIIGEALAKRLSKGMNVLYVGKFPPVAQYRYSYMFIVDDGTKKLRKMLSKFADKAQLDNSRFIFVVGMKEASNKYVSKIVENREELKTVIIGDIFGKGVNCDFIRQAFIKREIKIQGDGLLDTHPVFLEDVVSGILEAAFCSNESSRIFYLFPKHPPTQISLAHMIQRAEPSVKIDFEKDKKQKNQKIVLPRHGKYLLDENYNIQGRIRSVFLKRSENEDKAEIDGHWTSHKNNLNAFPLIAFLSLIFVLLLPVILTLFFSFAGFWAIDKALESLYREDLVKAKRQVELSHNFFLIADKMLIPFVAEAKAVGKELKAENFVRSITVGKEASLAGVNLGKSLDRFTKVFSNQSRDPTSDFIFSSQMLKEFTLFLQKAQVKNDFILGLDKVLADFEPLIKLGGNTEILPNLFGFEADKIYLVLFQNNSKLRSTGGAIEAYGFLTMSNGSVKDFSMHDVYEADSRLKGHVEPPFPIRRYVKEQHWYLKDSNFDIDFIKSSSKSAFFVDVELGEKVDGVIAIDASFVKQLVSLMGNVYIADYKKNVDGNNFYELYASDMKKDFLRKVFDSILLEASSRKDLAYLSWARVISNSIVQKHVLLAFSNPDIQDFFTLNNYSSSFWGKGFGKENVINDFIGINETDLGKDRADTGLNRMVSHDVGVDDKGNVSLSLVIIYDNRADDKPTKDYKKYLRIILDDKAQVLSIYIDGKDQEIVEPITDPAIYEPQDFVAPRGLEVEKTKENGKSVFGFLINVSEGERQTISIEYSLPQASILNKPSFLYGLNYFKQPGTEPYPFELSIKYPLAFRSASVEKEFVDKDGRISLVKNIDSDQQMLIKFVKK